MWSDVVMCRALFTLPLDVKALISLNCLVLNDIHK